MAQEKEIKIILKIPLNQFIKRISTKGFQKQKILHQTDKYYDTNDWFLYNNLAALRLRRVNEEIFSFTFKKLFYLPDRSDNYFIEEIKINYPFEQIGKLETIFSRLQFEYGGNKFDSDEQITNYLSKQDYHDSQIIHKTRQVYTDGENEFTIDKVDKVGLIIELECRKLAPSELIQEYLRETEWERSVEGTSYMWLKKVMGFDSHLKNLERFNTKPDWNVWENEREMYQSILEKTSQKDTSHLRYG